jgi:hypothetical protein
MLSKRDVFEIHRLKDKGLSIRQIAIKLNMDRGTVDKYIQFPEKSDKKSTRRPSKLDTYKNFKGGRRLAPPAISPRISIRNFRICNWTSCYSLFDQSLKYQSTTSGSSAIETKSKFFQVRL